MWINTYKGCTLQGWPGTDVVAVTFPGCALPHFFNSLHAAKCYITRYLKTQE